MLMRHATTGGIADLPDLPMWRALGWEPHDGPLPPEPDPTCEPDTTRDDAAGIPAAIESPPAPAGPPSDQPDTEE